MKVKHCLPDSLNDHVSPVRRESLFRGSVIGLHGKSIVQRR